MKKRTSWDAWVAIDRKSGDYKAGYVPVAGRPMRDFCSIVRDNYPTAIIKRATLTLTTTKPRRKRK